MEGGGTVSSAKLLIAGDNPNTFGAGMDASDIALGVGENLNLAAGSCLRCPKQAAKKCFPMITLAQIKERSAYQNSEFLNVKTTNQAENMSEVIKDSFPVKNSAKSFSTPIRSRQYSMLVDKIQITQDKRERMDPLDLYTPALNCSKDGWSFSAGSSTTSFLGIR